MSGTFHGVIHGDCLKVMARELEPEKVDAIVTDPPYGLGFMGKQWDHGVPGVPFWTEALRVSKPGAHLVAFGGSRTFHRLTVAIEDAGWEIRDCLMWLYGSGFPKSRDIAKAIDQEAGVAREVIGQRDVGPDIRSGNFASSAGGERMIGDITEPTSARAREWAGWGTALKPAWEPIILARKPFAATVAANVLAHGTGALNIEACKIGTDDTRREKRGGRNDFPHEDDNWTPRTVVVGSDSGRWPANVLLDEAAAAQLGEQTPGTPERSEHDDPRLQQNSRTPTAISPARKKCEPARGADAGGTSRFFYTAKASRSERDEGLEGSPKRSGGSNAAGFKLDVANGIDRNRPVHNFHPTVKPLEVMRWLCRLITPPGGLILDPFTGSGSTGCAALSEGFGFVGIELDADFAELARQRILHHGRQMTLGL